MKMFHGGPSGLSVKGFILPSDETKVYSCTDATANTNIQNPHRTDRIYISPVFRAAEMFAAMAPHVNVSIYEVEPIGDVEPDPDCDDPTMSFQAEKAKILREKRLPGPRRRRILSALGLTANFQ
jgi:hypothetical protein